MNCPVCGGKTHISHIKNKEDGVFRIRQCLTCHYRFGTLEEMIKKVKKGEERC